LASDSIREVLEDLERGDDHLRRLWRGIELADDADGAAGPSRAEKVPFEDENVTDAELGEVEGGRDAGDATADDDDVGGSHDSSFKSRTGSSRRMTPSASTRAYTRLDPGCCFWDTRE